MKPVRSSTSGSGQALAEAEVKFNHLHFAEYCLLWETTELIVHPIKI